MVPISLVITAPRGRSKCLLPDEILRQADGHSLEIIIADSAERPAAPDRPGLRHIFMPNASVFSLRGAGLAAASKEWIVLIEDHCKPLPGMLEAFRGSIEKDPDALIITGCVTNETSVTAPQWAHSMYGNRYEYWPAAKVTPRIGSISNMAMRRSVLDPGELGMEGGFETIRMPRLARLGRSVHCRKRSSITSSSIPGWNAWCRISTAPGRAPLSYGSFPSGAPNLP